jgi:hypothetical protein
MHRPLIIATLILSSGSGLWSGHLWGQAPEPATTTTPPRPAVAPTAAQLQDWVRDLGAQEYAKRTAATKQLLEAGTFSVPALVESVRSPDPEIAIRSLEILTRLYLQEPTDQPSAVEEIILQMRESSGVIGELAEASWETNTTKRVDRALVQLQAYGARVDFHPIDEGFDAVAGRLRLRPRKSIRHIAISSKWRGGDEQLKLIQLIHTTQTDLLVYLVNGAMVSEAAVDLLAQSGIRVELRGAYLGVSAEFPQQGRGCTVGSVTKDSPAEKGGLQKYDRIVRFGDVAIENFDDLIANLRKTKPGDQVKVAVIRDGDIIETDLTLADW